MTQEEQIRLYRLMEKLNWFFHQEMHYLDRDTAEKTARECYPEIRDFTYDILWNDLPKEVQEQLMVLLMACTTTESCATALTLKPTPCTWIPRPKLERKYPFASPACWPTGLKM